VRTALARRFAALLVVLGVTGCALPSARWIVPAGAQDRYAESRRACHQLTDELERFDDCMSRRGFERESLGARIWRGMTGG
jgi:hypothetical protein